MVCFNKNIKGREVALLWVGMVMWCVVNKNIKEKEKGSCCTCFAPYNVRLLPLLLSKSNRFALPFFSVRDEVQSKKAIKILLYHRKCITFATH
jgi:hypothetical protein